MEPLPLLLQLNALARLPRSGWLQGGLAKVESVADHSQGTAQMALILGPRVTPALDVERAISLAVVHDAAEALVTDLPHPASRLLPDGAKHTAERGAAQELFGDDPSALALWEDVHANGSREARFVRACDKLHLGLQLLVYLRAGARGLEGFEDGLVELDLKEFAPCEALRNELVALLARERSR